MYQKMFPTQKHEKHVQLCMKYSRSNFTLLRGVPFPFFLLPTDFSLSASAAAVILDSCKPFKFWLLPQPDP